MRLEEKQRKNIQETKYLNVENSYRYRSIIRYMYMEYERSKWLIYKEDIFFYLKQFDDFLDYTKEDCDGDLEQLCAWGNLKARQEVKNFKSIEEYRNKKFRYEITKPSIEIEEMLFRLQNLHMESFSLETNLLERMTGYFETLEHLDTKEKQKNYAWWEDLYHDFNRLKDNYRNYMKELESHRSEQLMQSMSFLAFRDAVVEYLGKFIHSLQGNALKIEEYCKKLDQSHFHDILETVVDYTLSIPNNENLERESYTQLLEDRFQSIIEWFCGREGRDSEVEHIERMTEESIDKITKYALRMTDFSRQTHNRKAEYQKVAELFYHAKSLEEAQKLSAHIFGLKKLLKLSIPDERKTDSITSSVFDEEPFSLPLKSRSRKQREKQKKHAIADHSQEKEDLKLAYQKKLTEEKALLERHIREQRLDFSNLELLEEHSLHVFLSWLQKAFQNNDYSYRGEDGRRYYIENPKESKRCVLETEIGSLEMPAFVLCFEEEEE